MPFLETGERMVSCFYEATGTSLVSSLFGIPGLVEIVIRYAQDEMGDASGATVLLDGGDEERHWQLKTVVRLPLFALTYLASARPMVLG